MVAGGGTEWGSPRSRRWRCRRRASGVAASTVSLRLWERAALGPVVLSAEMEAREDAPAGRRSSGRGWKAAVVFEESAVADQLGVETAVVGVVDLLGHEAVEDGANGGGGVGGVDGEGGGLLGCCQGGGDEGGGQVVLEGHAALRVCLILFERNDIPREGRNGFYLNRNFPGRWSCAGISPHSPGYFWCQSLRF